MAYKRLTVDDMREMINKGEAKDPLIFLESVMSGQDPRRLSSIHELILEIDAFSNGEISHEDWAEIVDHVSTHYKYKTVSLAESTSAAKTLAEYLHAKRKHVEMSGGSTVDDGSSEPLTEDEIELFKEKFNDEF